MDPGRADDVARRLADLEDEIGRLRSDNEILTSDVTRLRHLLDAHLEQETPTQYVLRRTRNIPASIRRRRRERMLHRTVAAERPEISAAELARQREIVDSFLAETGATHTSGPHRADDAAGLSLTTSDEPTVSVVIPVYGAIDEVITCLRSFVRHQPETPYEVIVANDATPEAQFSPVRGVGGIRILDQPENVGFLANCNAAAGEARGDYVWFLNSDTELRPGALDELFNTFEIFPDAAIVGSKLLFADGLLQDAGGIVWSDASAWNYGRGWDPTRPEVDYARRSDYVSGASLMIRRDVLEELGRFDTAFVPAYYEDTDLCMQARHAGYSVIYQPTSVIVHHEGASHGTDVDDTSSPKHHQKLNQETFLRKWNGTLATHRPNGVEPELEKEREIETRVLVIDARTLSPDQDSGSLRMFNVFRALQSIGAKVSFVPQNLTLDEPYATDLRRHGVEMIGLPHVADIETFLRGRGTEFDVVVLTRLEVAEVLVTAVRRLCPNATVVYDTVDLHFLRQQRELACTGEVSAGADPEDTRRQELSCVVRSDLTLVCSTVEKTLLGRLLPESRVEVLGNVHELVPTTTPPSARSGLLFVGGFEHPPNIDAMEWFTTEIHPLVTAAKSGTTLHIVGSKMPDRVKELAGPDVIVHGYVPDLTPLYEATRACIAPLRYGAGVKGKVTEALARGVPCVGTTMAVEGAGLVDGRHLLIADDAERFAAQCLLVLEDDELWRALAAAGLEHLEAAFGLDHTAEVLARTLTPHRRPSHTP